MFPILAHPSLAGCSLVAESQQAEVISYALACTPPNRTTGRATWTLTPHALHGRLDVTLGGKNMTFGQRIVARPIGDCRRP